MEKNLFFSCHLFTCRVVAPREFVGVGRVGAVAAARPRVVALTSKRRGVVWAANDANDADFSEKFASFAVFAAKTMRESFIVLSSV